MTTTRLTRLHSPLNQQRPEELRTHKSKREPEEPGIRADTTEAIRLYQRGVAAARGGQRRIAAGLLTRSVQLDPNNEGAWLWLSGVLDDPHQIAFCLHAVLKLNPANERARKGLQWLEERQLLKGHPQPTSLFSITVGGPTATGAKNTATPATSRQPSEAWWVYWRQWRNDRQRVSLLLWSLPLMLLLVSLLLYRTFEAAGSTVSPPGTLPAQSPQPDAVIAEIPREAPRVVMPLSTMPVVGRPTPVPILNAEPAAIRESRMIAYINRLAPIRKQLRDAVDGYRSTTGQPGSTTVSHAAAAQNLRTSIDQAHTVLLNTPPPPELQTAHEAYLKGLEIEREAIDAMVAFYGSYQVKYANLAALRFQEANHYFQRARLQLDTRLQELQASRGVSAHSIR